MNQKSVNAIRMLSVDAINQANSGHPGVALGAAPIAYTLWTKHLKVNPHVSKWFNRDRFILAAGHGSSMLYSLLHLSSFDVSLDDLKNFRKFGSKTPGHPEYGHTDGIDATSGPLGQGIPMGIGMALAESFLSAKYNKDIYNIIDHYTYVLCGDGDLQEGVTQEGISLAGHLGLGKLIVLYDSNDIQLDGPVSLANSEDVKQKYEAMNWQYLLVKDGNDLEEIDKAIKKAKKEISKPTIIEVKTVIGFGSPLAGDSASHGAPLGEEHTGKLREELVWEHEPFTVPEEVYEDFLENVVDRGKLDFDEWNYLYNDYKKDHPELEKELAMIINNKLPRNLDKLIKDYEVGHNEATRASGGKILNQLSDAIPHLIGGSADLTKSTKAKGIGGDFTSENRLGRNINYGVREHAMAAICNGMTLHGLKTFTGAFFVFSDYLKPAVRMAALMKIPSIFVFTHDSIAVGEDGPTHQPIEQLAMLRATPNVNVIRPCDANETKSAWLLALSSKNKPTVITLSRQNLEVRKNISHNEISKGAYVISDKEDYEGILIACGSEVSLAIDAQDELAKHGVIVRVVSMPSQELFEEQSDEYKERILPSSITKRLAIEMGSTFGWYKYAKNVMGIDTFGASSKGEEVIEKYGFTKDNVVKEYLNIK